MKRFLSITLMFCLLITLVPNISSANLVSEPKLVIENAEIPVLISGKENVINFVLKNIGSTKANEIRMTPIFPDDISIFRLNSLTSGSELLELGNGKEIPVELKLEVSPEARSGDYSFSLKFDYKYTELIYNPGGSYPNITYDKPDEVTIKINVRIDDRNNAPRLMVSSIVTEPRVIVPGSDFKLRIEYQNKGTLPTKNVSVKLNKLSGEGLFLASGTDVQYIKQVKGNDASHIDFNLKSALNIKKGGHELEVIFSYGGIEETQKVYINVGGDSSQSSNILIENLSYPTTAIKANGNFVLKFDLRNNGGVNANNIIVKAESSDPTVIPKTTSIQKITTIAPDGKESFEFIFSPTEEAITRNYPINISVEYEDEFNQDDEIKHKINQYVGIYVEKSGEDSTKGKPKLIIDKYNFEPQLVRAGENFEMTLSFYNTSSNKTVKNIKIFLTAEAGSTTDSPGAGSSAFTPVDSSNTFYIDSIPARGRVEKKITMFTIPDAIAKTHTITANFEYEDNEGNELKDIELIGVPVVQNSKLETGELSYYPEAMVGQPMPISLEFFNTGKVTLYNMMVKLDGDFQTENASYYVGNFATGSSEYFEGMVIPSQPGELKGAVLFTYEDSTGQMQELRKEFTLNVMEMPPMEEFPGEMPPMEEEPAGLKGILKSKWLWISLVAILAVVGGVIFYKKKKKKKEMAFDE